MPTCIFGVLNSNLMTGSVDCIPWGVGTNWLVNSPLFALFISFAAPEGTI